MPNQKKTDAVSSLVTKLEKSPNFVVVDFDSATHQKMEALRQNLYEKTARLEVAKNTLLKIALQKIGRSEVATDDVLKGSSAIVTMRGEWTEVLAAFFKSAKTDEAFSFKAGVIDGVFYAKDGLLKLAQLPSKPELIAKLLVTFKSPQTRIVRTMTFGMSELVNTLKQAGQKSQ